MLILNLLARVGVIDEYALWVIGQSTMSHLPLHIAQPLPSPCDEYFWSVVSALHFLITD